MVRWDPEKNERLKLKRGVSFEELMQAEVVGDFVSDKRAGQMMLFVLYNDYIWVIPYVKEGDGGVFLKTAFPSRKFMWLSLKGELI